MLGDQCIGMSCPDLFSTQNIPEHHDDWDREEDEGMRDDERQRLR